MQLGTLCHHVWPKIRGSRRTPSGKKSRLVTRALGATLPSKVARSVRFDLMIHFKQNIPLITMCTAMKTSHALAGPLCLLRYDAAERLLCWAGAKVRGHSTTTWTEFCHFLTPPPLMCGQFLYPERGQKQTFFDPLLPSSCPRSY